MVRKRKGEFDMGWQEEYRSLFPAVKQCVYLDNAYDCGSTTFGMAAMQKYFDDWTKAAVHVERGGPGRESHFKVIDETREMIVKLCGAESIAQVAFTRNTNEGLSAILQGFPFQPGDNIVTNEIEHHSVIMPALNIEKTKGVSVRVLPERKDERIPVEDLLSLCDEHTRMILVSHVQSVTGYRIDLETLGMACKERGIYLVVDAIQSLGLEPFEFTKWNISAVNGAGYKSLNAVNSIGFTVYQLDFLEQIWPVYIAAGFYNDIAFDGNKWNLVCSDPRNAKKMENSSLDNPGIYVLHDSLKILLEIGVDQIETQVRKLYRMVYEGLEELNYPIITPKEEGEHLAILSLRPKQCQPIFDFFRSKNIALSISGGNHVRFSFGGYTNEEDVRQMLEAAKELKDSDLSENL